MTKHILLTQGKQALVDDDEFDELALVKWCYRGGYAVRTEGTRANQRTVVMHRLVMDAPANAVVDHINGDKLDNRRCNLRLATTAENIRNSARSVRNTSGFKGVSFDRSRGKWFASICANRKLKNLGRYATAEEAARVYDRAARELHGEFAKVNFPEEGTS